MACWRGGGFGMAEVYRGIIAKCVRYRAWIEALIQIAAFASATLGAFLLRFDFTIPATHAVHLWTAVAVWCVTKSTVFFGFRLHRSWWRYVSMEDVVWLVASNLVGSAVGTTILYLFGPKGFPRSVYLLDFVLCLGATCLIRVAARLAAEGLHGRIKNGGRKAALIYGAGDAGYLLAREIKSNQAFPYELAGFLDDDPSKKGARILGVPVFGSGADLARIKTRAGAELVLIAMPSANGQEMTRVLNQCVEAGVEYKTMPAMGEVIENGGLLAQMRPVDVEDLLGRNAVRLDVGDIEDKLRGQVVLVTGAAGSIGSELCRQIAKFGPARLVGLDAAETPLFFLEREMRAEWPELEFAAEMGNIQNRRRLDEVFEKYSPAVVFHAAAYKHVPMVEACVFEAVENNVFGTLQVAECSAEHGVEDFVMISTDKAVQPTNMMGATKRLAELVVRGLQAGSTKFVSVRFGNVLGSNGSVIPIFKEQIAKGGPVTVTHPEMRRYFMTIPEAAQLVLQASTLGEGGEIFVLDMGEPVKIADLARNLILLSGLRPGQDIRIEYSGVRPGEKLYEELHLADENTKPTKHEKILVFGGQSLKKEQVERLLAELRAVCQTRDLGRLLLTVKSVVRDYNVSSELLERVIGEKDQAGGEGMRVAEVGSGSI